MIEKKMDLWDDKEIDHGSFFVRLITTNSSIKKNGCCVMGRGVALQARNRYPGIDRILAEKIRKNGNVINHLVQEVYSFPVKHNWLEKADLDLIKRSTEQLWKQASCNHDFKFYLPRPGCGNGKLSWDDVKPIVDTLPSNVIVVHN